MIRIQQIYKGKGLTDFLRVTDALYQDDPLYVPQLELERRLHLGPKNPYFKHARAQFWVAYDDAKPVGRISAQIDTLAQIKGQDPIGHFGFLEAVNENILNELLKTAQNWLRAEGIKKIIGPYSLSINDESGLLVEGFETSPRMMMNYAKNWYGPSLEAAGYKKAKDLLAFRLNTEQPLPLQAQRMAAKGFSVPGLVERPLNPKRIKQDLQIILNIFNAAWADNWGFIPMTREEIDYTAHSMKPLIKPELARIVEINNVPIAMIVALPDLNEALEGLKGRLLPIGWAKLLWRLKARGLKGGRVLLMGVMPEYRRTFLGSSIAVLLIQKLRDVMVGEKYQEAEMSWVLEDNLPIIRLIENVGGKFYKRYRLYEKDMA